MAEKIELLTPLNPLQTSLPGAGPVPATVKPMELPGPSTKEKKSFLDTTAGQIFTSNGGLGGLFDAVGKARDAFGRRPSPASLPAASGDYLSTGSGSRPQQETTIMGLPPLAFAGLALVVVSILGFAALRAAKA